MANNFITYLLYSQKIPKAKFLKFCDFTFKVMHFDVSIIVLTIIMSNDVAAGQLLLQLFQVYTSHIRPMCYNQQYLLISYGYILLLQGITIGCTSIQQGHL